jgi:hypothetical protein
MKKILLALTLSITTGTASATCLTGNCADEGYNDPTMKYRLTDGPYTRGPLIDSDPYGSRRADHYFEDPRSARERYNDRRNNIDSPYDDRRNNSMTCGSLACAE